MVWSWYAFLYLFHWSVHLCIFWHNLLIFPYIFQVSKNCIFKEINFEVILFPSEGWYIFWLILMNLQTFASFSIICCGSPEETINADEYISIPNNVWVFNKSVYPAIIKLTPLDWDSQVVRIKRWVKTINGARGRAREGRGGYALCDGLMAKSV